MTRHDFDAADDHDPYGDRRDYTDSLFAFYGVSGGETDAGIYPVSGSRPAGGGVWAAGGLLSEKCQSYGRKPWDSGGSLYCGRDRSPSLETADAGLHRRRDRVLYAAGAACFLVRSGENEYGGFAARFRTESIVTGGVIS